MFKEAGRSLPDYFEPSFFAQTHQLERPLNTFTVVGHDCNDYGDSNWLSACNDRANSLEDGKMHMWGMRTPLSVFLKELTIKNSPLLLCKFADLREVVNISSTKELTQQIEKVMQASSDHLGMKVPVYVGALSEKWQYLQPCSLLTV